MRKGFDGLCGLVENELDLDPLIGRCLFFCQPQMGSDEALAVGKQWFCRFGTSAWRQGLFKLPASNAQSLSLELGKAGTDPRRDIVGVDPQKEAILPSNCLFGDRRNPQNNSSF